VSWTGPSPVELAGSKGDGRPADVRQVVYRDMKEGFLADDTDHGTREVREVYKGM
jgi:hypothetical protein